MLSRVNMLIYPTSVSFHIQEHPYIFHTGRTLSSILLMYTYIRTGTGSKKKSICIDVFCTQVEVEREWVTPSLDQCGKFRPHKYFHCKVLVSTTSLLSIFDCTYIIIAGYYYMNMKWNQPVVWQGEHSEHSRGLLFKPAG